MTKRDIFTDIGGDLPSLCPTGLSRASTSLFKQLLESIQPCNNLQRATLLEPDPLLAPEVINQSRGIHSCMVRLRAPKKPELSHARVHRVEDGFGQLAAGHVRTVPVCLRHGFGLEHRSIRRVRRDGPLLTSMASRSRRGRRGIRCTNGRQ